jgi:hypothetical protein
VTRASGSLLTPSFEDLFETSVKENISKLLGSIVLKSISFYFDSKILIRDPTRFVEAFRSLFGNTATMLEKEVKEDLGSKLGVPVDQRNSLDFRSFVKSAKVRFSTKPSSLRTSA